MTANILQIVPLSITSLHYKQEAVLKEQAQNSREVKNMKRSSVY